MKDTIFGSAIILLIAYILVSEFVGTDPDEQLKAENEALADTLKKERNYWSKLAIPGVSSNDDELVDSLFGVIDVFKTDAKIKRNEIFTLNQTIIDLKSGQISGVIKDTVYLGNNIIRYPIDLKYNEWLSFSGYFQSNGLYNFSYDTQPIKLTTLFKEENKRLRVLTHVSFDIPVVESTSFYDLSHLIDRRTWKFAVFTGTSGSIGGRVHFKQYDLSYRLGRDQSEIMAGYTF